MLGFDYAALGRSSPSLAELRARSTSEAVAVWGVATRLARWRSAGYDRFDAHAEACGDASVAASRGAGERGINAADLARALVVLHPERIEAGDLAGDARTWRGRVEATPPMPSGTVSYALGRRFTALDPQVIDVDTLFCALPHAGVRTMASMLPAFREGLVTLSEAYVRIVDALGACGRIGAVMPTAWWERQALAVDDARPGYAIVGPPGSGKRALMRRMKAFFPARGVNVDNFHGAGAADPRYRSSPSTVYAAMRGDLPMLCCWSDAGALEPELLAYALEVALDPQADLRLIVGATKEAFAEVLGRNEKAARLRVLSIAPFRDDELLTVWLCQRPRVEDVLGCRIDLDRILGRLGYLQRYAPASAVLRGMIERLDITGRAEHIGSDWAQEVLGPRTEGTVLRGRSVERAWQRLTKGVGAWMLPLIPSPEQLRKLVELDAAISGERSRWDAKK